MRRRAGHWPAPDTVPGRRGMAAGNAPYGRLSQHLQHGRGQGQSLHAGIALRAPGRRQPAWPARQQRLLSRQPGVSAPPQPPAHQRPPEEREPQSSPLPAFQAPAGEAISPRPWHTSHRGESIHGTTNPPGPITLSETTLSHVAPLARFPTPKYRGDGRAYNERTGRCRPACPPAALRPRRCPRRGSSLAEPVPWCFSTHVSVALRIRSRARSISRR
jgi:hypothetical protein